MQPETWKNLYNENYTNEPMNIDVYRPTTTTATTNLVDQNDILIESSHFIQEVIY